MNARKIMREDDDPYDIGGYSSSDNETGDSSGDELTVQDLLRRQRHDNNSSEEDEFEKEMDVELESVLQTYESEAAGKVSSESDRKENENIGSSNKRSSCDTSQDGNSTYSKEYFSSGSDDEHKVGGQASKSKEQRRVLTNEELLYDPDMDDEDEKWVVEQRRKYRRKVMKSASNTSSVIGSDGDVTVPSGTQKKQQKTSKLNMEKAPSSDAILSCPACMTTLCIDCQRHEIYKNQYRAMFVMNCNVSKNEVLRYEPSSQQRKFGKRKKGEKGKLVQHTQGTETDLEAGATPELYHPVTCSECSTEVAVYDNDEVYHFFNVLTSHA